MDLEIIILSEAQYDKNNILLNNAQYYHTKPDMGRQMSYNSAYMWNLKKNTKELIHKTERDSQTQKINLQSLWPPDAKT